MRAPCSRTSGALSSISSVKLSSIPSFIFRSQSLIIHVTRPDSSSFGTPFSFCEINTQCTPSLRSGTPCSPHCDTMCLSLPILCLHAHKIFSSIFSLSAMLSALVVNNVVGQVSEDQLQQIELFSKFGQLLRQQDSLVLRPDALVLRPVPFATF